ncbi:glycerophosphodiester phosphodiesterase [Phycicoccus sp. CSK15P-2]|uniref:glycerophosphodiester phosphodiesterase n=1 Tax=Phycicoccus sp. CSK15P-2 TaxID=2807627 RepID=UPI00194E23A9|nr:glycerophosphodiester phosphodiesterase family protein [Phycicoccus sp. CSK15P-2]MBM6403434.1 glycerophosphodiester phosphodiesterase [Phycicoccus sp. CSK15P-2]
MTDEQYASARRPLVIAHRGASAEEAEHTLPAYRLALGHGADGVECDVRLTADHHLVCVHDRRVDRTSDGSGRVSALELARLEELDWASWRTDEDAAEGPDADPERGRLLTLRRLLDDLVEQGDEVLTLVETKHPTRHGDDVEKTLVQVLRAFDLDGGDEPGRPHVRVMSFSGRALQRVHRISPKVALVQLVEAIIPAAALDGSLSTGVRAVGLPVATVRRKPGIVERYHRNGHEVYVWTVDDLDDVDLCVELDVDVIITNRPREVVTRVASSG